MKLPVVVTRAALSVRHAMEPASGFRANMQAVRVERFDSDGGTAVVATDGHILAAVLSPDGDGPALPTMLAGEAVKTLAKLAGPPGKRTESVRLTHAGAELESGATVALSGAPDPSEYPEWRRVFRSVTDSPVRARITLDPKCLTAVLKAAAEYAAAAGTETGTRELELLIREDTTGPMEFRLFGADKTRFVALAMPMRGDVRPLASMLDREPAAEPKPKQKGSTKLRSVK